MEWLNIHIPTIIRSPEFIGSSPVERATWFCVIAYCCELENGGRLTGATHWKDRQWQQSCGVTAKEVRSASKLLIFDGDDVIVLAYPIDKEMEVKRLRGQARAGARARWTKPQTGMPEGMPQGIDKALAEGNAERKGREGNGKEGKERGSKGKTTDAPSASVPSPQDFKKKKNPASDDEFIDELKKNKAYTGIDIETELGKLDAWLMTPRGRGKTKTRGRIVNWLNRVDKPLLLAPAPSRPRAPLFTQEEPKDLLSKEELHKKSREFIEKMGWKTPSNLPAMPENPENMQMPELPSKARGDPPEKVEPVDFAAIAKMKNISREIVKGI